MSSRPVVVVKFGSSTLLDEQGALDLAFLDHAAEALAAMVAAGVQPVVVSSGAVASGRALLPNVTGQVLSERQALAATGQAGLVHRWQVAFAAHGLVGAQILLTADDFDHRLRYLNLTAALRALFANGVVPVVNENDVVAVDELTVGDNDRLSALLAAQLGAHRLLLLTDTVGLYDRDPRQHSDAVLLSELPQVTATELAAAGDPGQHGRGGMRSKLLAAQRASEAGVEVHIAHGRQADIVAAGTTGESVGTRVAAQDGPRPTPVRRWLSVSNAVDGALIIDDGAVAAVRNEGRSLLPVGITAVEGTFVRGDAVAVRTASGDEVARGLVTMSSIDLGKIVGQRLEQAAQTLGYDIPKAAIHRDNLLPS